MPEHFIASENYEKGAEYSRFEAKKYQKSGLFNEAIEYQKWGVSCLERMPQSEETQKKVIDARTKLVIYNLSLGHYAAAKEAVEPVMELALKLNYRKRLPGIYIAMGLHALWTEEDFSSGTPYISNSLRISEEVGDFLSSWLANFHLGMCLAHQCEFEKSSSHIEKCVNLSELARNPIGISISKATIAQMYNIQGNIGQAYMLAEEALDLAQGSGDEWSKGWAYTHYGCALYYKGEIEKAEKYLLDGLTYCQQTFLYGGEAWAAFTIGNVYLDSGKYRQADKYYIIAGKALEVVKMFPSWINTIKTWSARAGAYIKGVNANCNYLFEYFEMNKLRVCEGIMARNIGEILLLMDDEHMKDAEIWIKKAIEADTRNGTRWHLATDHVLYSDWYKKKGDLSSSKEEMKRAIEIFAECGADGWVKKYEKE